MQTSPQFNLDLKDIIKGFMVAAISAVIASFETSITAGTLTFNWQTTSRVALAAGLSYLCKNFFTPSKIVIPALKSETKS